VTFDITPFLVAGSNNVIGVELGNAWFAQQGWYQLPPYMGCSSAASPNNHGQGSGTCNGGGFSYDVPNQLILSAQVTTKGGQNEHDTTTRLTSGNTGWTAGAGPITFDSIYDGEHYDARLEQPGWDTPAFKPAATASWIAATAVKDSKNPLVNATLSAQLYEPIKVVAQETAVSRWIGPNNSFIFDFGTNMVGVVRLSITNPDRGRTVTLKHAEATMHPPYGMKDGSLYFGSLRNAHATDLYTMKGSDTETYEPKFTSHGFRYLEILGLEHLPEDADVVRLVIHNDVATSTSFEVNSDADVLNKINMGCRNGIGGNLLGGPGSCGGRDERQFFTGDTAMAGEASLIQFELPALYTHSLQTMADQQRKDGAIGDYFPDTVGDNRDGHANWGTAFPYVTWLVWWYHGDTAVITRTLSQLNEYMAFHAVQYDKTSQNGFKNYWGSCIHGWTVVGPVSECSLMTAFAYVNELRLMAEMAAAVGDTELSSAYQANHTARLAIFHTSFYSNTTGDESYGADTLDDLAMSLWLDAPPTPGIKTAIAARLRAKVEEQLGIVNPNSSAVAHGTAMSGGVGVRYLYEALSRNGHTDVALRLAMRKTYPSYGYFFYNEYEPATTMWELWSSDMGSPSMDSRNHIYSASITTFLTKHLAGIDGVAAGFDRIVIAPLNIPLNTTSNLSILDAAVGTPHGQISSSWALLTPGASPTTCDVQAEGTATHCTLSRTPPKGCTFVLVGCNPGATITAVPFASFGTINGTCPKSLAVGKCHSGQNVTAYVTKRCLGKETCKVYVDNFVFGDPCEGVKKQLGVEVTCGAGPSPSPSWPVYRLDVTVPVGSEADVVVPLRGQVPGSVVITEGGVNVWSGGKFVGPASVQGVTSARADHVLGGIRFTVVQGSYHFKLLVQ
jgi:alpha-L-rhamnosidase